MITHDRRCWNGIWTTMGTREFASPHDALAVLVETELCWGGEIVTLSPTRLETKTIVLAATDYCVFDGPADEMELLTRMARIYLKNRQKFRRQTLSHSAWLRAREESGTKGRVSTVRNRIQKLRNSFPTVRTDLLELFKISDADAERLHDATAQEMIQAAFFASEYNVSLVEALHM